MSSIGRIIREGHQPPLTEPGSERVSGRRRQLPGLISVSLALLLGASLALVTMLPMMWMALVCLALCGVFGVMIWLRAHLPLIPVLRFLLIFSYSFRLEINLFSVQKYHEAPPGINLSLTLILSAMLAFSFLVVRGQSGECGRIVPPGYSGAWAAMFLCCCIAVLFSSEQLLGVYALFWMLTTALISFAAAASFSDRAALREAALAIAVSIGFSGVIALAQYLFGFATDWKILGAVAEEEAQMIADGSVTRVAGLLTAANAFAWYLVSFLPLLVALVLLQLRSFRRWQQSLLIVASALGVMALVLSFARGSWVSFALSIMLLLALAYRVTPLADRRRFIRRMTVVAALGAVMSLPFAPLIYTRLTEDDRGSAASRVPLMEVAFKMIRDNPWFGVGLSAYEAEMRRYDQTEEKITDDFDWPVHNIFLHITAEAGIPAFLLFLLLIGIVCRHGWLLMRSRDPLLRAYAIGLLAGIFAFMFTGMKELGSIGSGNFRFFFFLAGLIFAAKRVSEMTDARAAQNENVVTEK